MVRSPARYGESSAFATTPSRPAPSNASNQWAATTTSVVAGVTCTGAAFATIVSSRARRWREGLVPQVVVAVGEGVERDEAGRGLLGELRDPARRRVDAQRQQVEVEAVVGGDDELAVHDRPIRQRGAQRVEDLGEVAVEGTLVAAAEHEVVAVAEHDAAEPVPLRLVRPGAPRRQLALEGGEHRRHWRRHGERHRAQRDSSATIASSATSSSTPVARTRRSATPRATPLAPTVTRTGRPSRSASANFTPGLASRSS